MIHKINCSNPKYWNWLRNIFFQFSKKQPRYVVSKDYNYACTKLTYTKEGILLVSFGCFNFKEIFGIAGDYMVKKYYSGIVKIYKIL